MQSSLNAGKIKFLADDRVAKVKLLGTTKGQKMRIDERNEYLKPFVLTSILKEQLLNLIEETEGMNIILRRSNKSIKKDKVSALVYALYYIREEEENRKRRGGRRFSDFMFMS